MDLARLLRRGCSNIMKSVSSERFKIQPTFSFPFSLPPSSSRHPIAVSPVFTVGPIRRKNRPIELSNFDLLSTVITIRLSSNAERVRVARDPVSRDVAPESGLKAVYTSSRRRWRRYERGEKVGTKNPRKKRENGGKGKRTTRSKSATGTES